MNKKINLLILFLLCSFSLTNCNKKTNESSNDNLPILTIGCDTYSPFFVEFGDSVFTGIDVELAKEACHRIGYKAVFKRINWAEKDNYLNNNEIDCLWSSFTMTGRENKYLWAGPYMNSSHIVVVSSNSDIYKLSDLGNKRIGVQITTKPDEIFSNNLDSRIPKIRNLYCFSSMDYVFAALRKGYVDAIAGHETAFLDFISTSTGKYRILNETLLDAKIGIAFKLNYDKSIVDSLTNSLISMKKDGFIANILDSYSIDSNKALEGILDEK